MRRDAPPPLLGRPCYCRMQSATWFCVYARFLVCCNRKRRKQQKGVVEPSNQNRVKKVRDASRCMQTRNLTRCTMLIYLIQDNGRSQRTLGMTAELRPPAPSTRTATELKSEHSIPLSRIRYSPILTRSVDAYSTRQLALVRSCPARRNIYSHYPSHPQL